MVHYITFGFYHKEAFMWNQHLSRGKEK